MVMGEIAEACDVLIIGAGPGGYVAAIRAAQLGKDVLVIDRAEIGGICLNHGCIPSKAVIHAAEIVENINIAHELGIAVGKPRVHAKKLNEWKNTVVSKLTSGIATLFKQYSIRLIAGSAKFVSSNKVRVSTQRGMKSIRFEQAIIATGSTPVELRGFAFDGKQVWSSRHALDLSSIPKRLVIIGGGYIGLELGCVYQKIGSLVTVVQRGSHLLPFVSQDAVRVVQKRMEQIGVTFLLDSTAVGLKKGKDVAVTLDSGGKKKTLSCDAVLVCIGRRPNSEDISLENTRVEVDEHGFIKVDKQMRTTDNSIFAIGDVAGQPMLAHKASREGHVAAEVISGLKSAFDNVVVPAVVFTDPEIALVGLSEEQAASSGYEVAVGKFPYSASGRALTTHAPSGFVKLICDKKTNLVLGGLIVGAHASDLISELTLAIEMSATAEDIALTIHPHPTFGEVIMEAAADVNREAIHIFKGSSSVKEMSVGEKKEGAGVSLEKVESEVSEESKAKVKSKPVKKSKKKVVKKKSSKKKVVKKKSSKKRKEF